MLVLQRKMGEKLVIGDGVVITVLGGSGTQVRIGIEAPRHVPIRREELPPQTLSRDPLGTDQDVCPEGAAS